MPAAGRAVDRPKELPQRGVLAAEDVLLARAAALHRQDHPLDNVVHEDPVADVPAEVQEDGDQAAVVHVDQSRHRVPFGQIAGPIDPRRVDDHHGGAFCGGLQGQPLACELASLVVGQATVGQARRGFVGQRSRRRRSGGELRGGPDDPPDPGPPRGVEHGQHRPHVQLVVDLAAGRPVLRVAGEVIDFGAAIDGAGDGVAIHQIGGEGLDELVIERAAAVFGQSRRRVRPPPARHRPDPPPADGQCPDEPRTDKPRRAGNKDFFFAGHFK